MEASHSLERRFFADRRDRASRDEVLRRVRAEFTEMPCLRLTGAQARRLFGLRADISERVMAALVGDGTLLQGPDGRYRLGRSTAWRAFSCGLPYESKAS